MKTNSAVLMLGSLLMLASPSDVRAVDGPLPLRYDYNAVAIHNGLTSQTIATSYGTNRLGLAFTGTATYDFYSPPLTTSVSLQTNDQGNGLFTFTDYAAANYPCRFYCAATP